MDFVSAFLMFAKTRVPISVFGISSVWSYPKNFSASRAAMQPDPAAVTA